MPSPIWDDIRRVADELELQIHLGSMEVRDRWRALQPRLAELETSIAREGERVGQVVTQQLSDVGAALGKLRDDLAKPS